MVARRVGRGAVCEGFGSMAVMPRSGELTANRALLAVRFVSRAGVGELKFRVHEGYSNYPR